MAFIKSFRIILLYLWINIQAYHTIKSNTIMFRECVIYTHHHHHPYSLLIFILLHSIHLLHLQCFYLPLYLLYLWTFNHLLHHLNSLSLYLEGVFWKIELIIVLDC